ncbi:hypothetical protein TNCV_4332741 [Trichonephila clavipes]|nr:hypothetical protein TNCV_4332741 [Trichonephila clavipes]
MMRGNASMNIYQVQNGKPNTIGPDKRFNPSDKPYSAFAIFPRNKSRRIVDQERNGIAGSEDLNPVLVTGRCFYLNDVEICAPINGDGST